MFAAVPPVAPPPSNIKWSLSSQPMPGMPQQLGKQVRAKPARSKAPKASKGFGSSKTEGSTSNSSAASSQVPPTPEQSEWYLRVIATRDLQPGEELLLCYRPDESNDGFMLVGTTSSAEWRCATSLLAHNRQNCTVCYG